MWTENGIDFMLENRLESNNIYMKKSIFTLKLDWNVIKKSPQTFLVDAYFFNKKYFFVLKIDFSESQLLTDYKYKIELRIPDSWLTPFKYRLQNVKVQYYSWYHFEMLN